MKGGPNHSSLFQHIPKYFNGVRTLWLMCETHAPLFHNLSPMNLSIVVLVYALAIREEKIN